MITLASVKTRVLQVLDDTTGVRFVTGLVDEAIRMAMDVINQKLPRMATLELTIATTGRDQVVFGLEDPLLIVGVCLSSDDQLTRELQVNSEFSFYILNDAPTLHFSGKRVPQAGDKLTITYAARHNLDDLDGEIATTFPEAYVTALVNGAAGYACQIRATRLIETYGARSEEASRTLEISKLRLDGFESLVNNLVAIQDFGFPPGFALDKDDSRLTGRYP